MQPEIAWNKHLFSHSIKNINRSLPLSQNPEKILQKFQFSPKKESSPKRKLSNKRSMWGESRKKYEEMIDEIIKKHIQDESMNLKMTKVFRKHSYKNYRILHTDQNQYSQDAVPRVGSENQSKKSTQRDKSLRKRIKTSNFQSQLKNETQKMIHKWQQKGIKLPTVTNSHKGHKIDAYREPNDFIQIQLKLKKLKEEATLDEINDFHKKISRKYIKTQSNLP